jgi:hypothetical protein
MSDETGTPAAGPRSKDEIALELMKFISLQTGYGKGAATAGFTGKSSTGSEEHAEALLALFERCRVSLHREPGAK